MRERVEKIQIHLNNAALEEKTRFSELICWFPSIYALTHSTNLLNARIAKGCRVEQSLNFSGLRECIICMLDTFCLA